MVSKKDNYIGLAMGLDVTDLKTGLNETKKEITTARKEFNATTAGMDDWSKSTEGLQAKLKELDTTIKNQKKNVAGYEAELEQAKQQYGENSEQVRKLRNGLLDAQTALGKSEKAQRKYTQALQDVETESKQATTATGKLTKSMKEADKATVDLKGGFTVLKGAMANLVSTGITSMVSGLQNIVSESREFRREMAYLEATADATGASFENAKENVKEVTSITEDQGAAIEGLNNLMSSGFDGDALDNITDQLLGASIKWKDTLKFEGLADGLQETLATGNAIGPFAGLLERAGLNLDDFNAGLASATTEADKQNYVLETLSKLGLKEIKDGYVEANKTLVDGAKANFEYSEAMAEVGEIAEPVLTSIKMGFANVLKAMFDTGEGIDSANIAGKISEAFGWFIETCVPFLQSALTWIIDNFKAISIAVGLVGGAFVAWKVVGIIQSAINAIKSMALAMAGLRTGTLATTASLIAQKVAMVAGTVATTAMTVAQKLLNLAMYANPILLIVSLIALLVTAFVTLWNKSEAFRNFWIGLWNGIENAVKPVIDWIVKAFTGAWNSIKKAWNGAIAFFTGIWNGIKNAFATVVSFFTSIFTGAWNAIECAWSAVTGFFGGIWSGIENVFSDVVSFFGGIFSSAWSAITSAFGSVGSFFGEIIDKIVGFFSSLPEKMIDIGKNMIDGLIDGIMSMVDAVKDAVFDAVMAPVNWVKDKLGIASPSKLMRDEIGKMMGLGVGEGLLASTKNVLKDAQQFTKKVTGGLAGTTSKINAGINASAGSIGQGVNGGSTSITNNYSQVINAPKQPSRLELYRQSKNLLGLKGVY